MRIVNLSGNLLKRTLNDIINVKEVQGVQWQRFTEFNNMYKGFRKGELSVLSGRTGIGKTTFLCEYSLDLCENGVATLWGSFEMPLNKICRTLLHQFAGEPLNADRTDRIKRWADMFTSQIPMHFMNLHGSQSEREVFDIMREAVKEHKVDHIILDNLQFMLGCSDNPREDRFQKQDRFVGMLRAFATQSNTHITLVAHPRKEEVNSRLTMSSLYGGVKLSQEADNVMLIQEDTESVLPKKYVEVVKNRYDGQLGRLDLRFVRDRLSFRPVDKALPISHGRQEEFTVLQ